MPDYREIKERFLKSSGGNVNSHLRNDCWGILHEAANRNDWKFVVWLVLHKGADPNFLTRAGNNALCIIQDESKITRFLLWKGCEPHYDKVTYRDKFVYYALSRKRILLMIISRDSPLHKDLWREVAGWFIQEEEEK